MLLYPASFSPEDQARVFRFLATFSRWECALKHNGFVRTGANGQAEPNWRQFATTHDAALAALNSADFVAARGALLGNPPRREEWNGNQIEWRPNPRRQAETTDADYLFRVVRAVRNNLFHGGKFGGGPAPELARDRLLIDSAIAVLENAAHQSPISAEVGRKR
jgi:hypothetical protein